MRAFSKNIYVRRMENDKIVSVVNKIKRNYKRNLTQFKNRKEYKYIKCDNCHQKMRVPRGKGKIKVTCPKCKYQMEVRSQKTEELKDNILDKYLSEKKLKNI